MPKRILRDIITKQTKRQRKIPDKLTLPKRELKEKILAPKSKNSKNKLYFGIGFVLIVFIATGALNIFSRVTLKVTPKQEFINISSTLKALSSSAELSFEVMEINKNKKGGAVATGVKDIKQKSKGEIVIYNAFSSKDQGLVERTRFEAPDGKIYRIAESIIVPGAKISGGEIVPSSIEVTVYADNPGEEYNMGLTDFTIPGFKGDVKYEKFYARSKTAMTGGFKGVTTIISKDDIERVRNSIRAELRDELIAEAKDSIPDDFILYDDAIIIEFNSSETGPKEGNKAEQFEIVETGILSGFLVRKSDISKVLTSKYLGIENNVSVVNLKDITFTLSERDKENTEIIFELEGRGHFVWDIDEILLKNELTKRNFDKYEEIFRNYLSIERAEIIFKPFWWRKIPKKPSRITYTQILKTE